MQLADMLNKTSKATIYQSIEHTIKSSNQRTAAYR